MSRKKETKAQRAERLRHPGGYIGEQMDSIKANEYARRKRRRAAAKRKKLAESPAEAERRFFRSKRFDRSMMADIQILHEQAHRLASIADGLWKNMKNRIRHTELPVAKGVKR